MASASRNPSTKNQGAETIHSHIANEFGRCARSFESQASACSRGLHTALFIQRFKHFTILILDVLAFIQHDIFKLQILEDFNIPESGLIGRQYHIKSSQYSYILMALGARMSIYL